MKPKNLFLMVGVPGSGKSTWVQKQLTEKPGIWCSRDAIRFSMVSEDEEYFARENEVFKTWIEDINKAIHNPEIENIYADATHLNKNSRNKTLTLLDLDNINVIPVVFDLPLEVCIARNEKRTGRALVPRSVIRHMYNTMTIPSKNEKFKYKDIILIRKEKE